MARFNARGCWVDKVAVAFCLLFAACTTAPIKDTSGASNEELCANMAITGSQPARTELLRRHALTVDELRIVNGGEVQLGMRPLLVLCALGRPTKVERGAMPNWERWTYVRYRKWIALPADSKYKSVSFENNKVVDLQL